VASPVWAPEQVKQWRKPVPPDFGTKTDLIFKGPKLNFSHSNLKFAKIKVVEEEKIYNIGIEQKSIWIMY